MPGPAQPHQEAKKERYILEGFTDGLHSEGAFSKTQILDTECTCAENIEFWPVGTISKRPGSTYKNSTTQLSGAVIALYQWWSAAGANYLIAFTAASAATTPAETISGTIYYIGSQTSQTTCTFTKILSSGELGWNPTTTSVIVVESFGGSAIFTNGVDQMFSWNGVSCSAMTTAPTGAACIRSYKNYLFAGNAESPAGTRQQSRLYWSDPGDAHTWPASNYLDLDADDGDYIVGMEILGNELIVFKERKIYAVTYVGGIYEFYSEARMSGVGCGAQGSIVPIFSELLFYGIESYYSFNGRDVESLSDKLKDIVTYAIQPSYRTTIRGITYEEKDQIWWLVPIDATTASGNTHVMVLDYSRDGWTIFTNTAACLGWYNQTSDLTFGDLAAAYSAYNTAWGDRLFLSNAALIAAGSPNGYILDCGTAGVAADLGVSYEGFWRSRWIDFGMPDINKRITRITVYIDKEVETEAADYNLYLYVYKDWDRSTIASSQTVSVYGDLPVLERRVDFTMSCRAMQLQIGSTLKDQPFTIHKIVIEYSSKGRTLV